ncbi:MAG: DUF3089 domain-containing protein [Halioglobus sp.]|nr:DUF3089 domain-containing protein [Halioglobus sp.]
MKRALTAAALLLVLLPLGVWGAFTLWSDDIVTARLKPDHTRKQDPITVPPDYRDDRYWASLPTKKGLANLVPAEQQARQGQADVAVFYLHPTSYLSGERWNSPLFIDSWAWEMVDRMMVSQASAFNACCDVYAPHYREATLWSFIHRESDDGLQALDLAYRDVAAAFDEFLWRFNNDRPFIIAGHSQGSAHALRLLAQRINDDAPLRERLVGAYLVGYSLPLDMFDRELTNIPPCESATDTGCVVHWATYGEGGRPESTMPHWYSDGWEYADHKKVLCTNPLSWRRGEERVPASEHPGALDVPASYGVTNLLFNSATGDKVTALHAVRPAWTWAQCRDGFLYIEPQLDGPFASPLDDESMNYHTRDYALFYQAIRENAQTRSAYMRR